MKYIPGFLLILGSWLQPLHVLPWVSWHNELLAFTGLAWLTGVLLLEMHRASENLLVPYAACLPAALGLYALLQCALGQIEFFGDALMIAFYLAACSMAITIGYQWGTKPALAGTALTEDALLGWLAWTVLGGAFFSVGIMCAQTFDVWNSADWIVRTEGYRRPGGNLGQPNHIATLILMGAASLDWLHETRRLGRVVTGMLVLMLALGLAMTESRTGILSAAALTVLWSARQGAPAWQWKICPIVAVWASLLLLVWIWPVFITYWHETDAGGVGRINAVVGIRSVVWAQLLEAALQRPWGGWGLREISKAHNAVLHQYQDGAPFTYAHNLLLDIVVGVGFPLALLLIALCAYWLWSRTRQVQTLTTWYCMALALPLIIHSMLEFPYAYAYFLIPVLLAIGWMEARTSQSTVLKIQTLYVEIAASLLFVLLAWSAAEYVAIEEDFRVARFQSLRVGQTPDEYTIPKTMLLTQLDAMLKATRIRPAPNMEAKDIELLRHAAMRFPWTAIQNRYALSLALNGHSDEAIRQMLVIRAMHGEKHYEGVRASWELQAEEKYPQLKTLALP